MATPTGLEPVTSGVTGRRSNQLNYGAILGAVSVHAQEPILSGGLSSELDLANTIIGKILLFRVMAASTGIEPAISSVTDWRALHCSTKLYIRVAIAASHYNLTVL